MFENNKTPANNNSQVSQLASDPTFINAANQAYASYMETKKAEIEAESEEVKQFWDAVNQSNIQFNETARAAINQANESDSKTTNIFINQPNNNFYSPKKSSNDGILIGLFGLIVGIFFGKKF